MNCVGFVNIVKNTLTINIFDSDDINIINIRANHYVMTTIKYMIFKPMIKIRIVAD